VPFAGWDPRGRGYNNGLQLIEFTPSSVTTAGAARTKGWVERGIFVGNRLVSLSSQSLAVVDYSAPMAPRVVSELTLARNVVTAQPGGATIAEVSSDWWGNDTSSSQVRVLPIDNAEETSDAASVPTVNVDGVGAQVFTNGRYTYVVSSVPPDRRAPATAAARAPSRSRSSTSPGGGAVLRGKIQLPTDASGWYGGWGGYWWWDWWWGNEVVQVGGDVLAFRRWEPQFTGSGTYLETQTRLYVVDLANPDAPQLASTVVQTDPQAWWGNMKVVGDTLYTTHYDWVEAPDHQHGWVRYYLDSVDLSDRAHPRIGAKVNVPGLLIGGDASDPSVILHDRLSLERRQHDQRPRRAADPRQDGDPAVTDPDQRLGRLDVHRRQAGVPVGAAVPPGWPRDRRAARDRPVEPVAAARPDRERARLWLAARGGRRPRAGDVGLVGRGRSTSTGCAPAEPRSSTRRCGPMAGASTACRARTRRCSCRPGSGACRRSRCSDGGRGRAARRW